MALAIDPVERYEKLTRTTLASPALAPAALQPIIEAAGEQTDSQVSALSKHVAEHSPLTLAEAQPVVAAALQGQAGPAAKASAVSQAATSVAGASAEIELSDPVMLDPLARTIFAGLFLVALVACIACITALGNASGTPGSALVSLAVLGVLALVGTLVLVMGYKNVTIKGGPPTGK